jgi:hypothetical protein
MLVKTEDLKEFNPKISTDFKGSILDMYFDDLFWRIQYLLIKANTEKNEKAILIPHVALGLPDNKTLTIPIIIDPKKEEYINDHKFNKSADEIKNTTPAKIIEMSLKQLNLPSSSAKDMKNLITTLLLEEHNVTPPMASHLRSRNDVLGYNIQAKNGELIGHVDDFILETDSWKLRYILIDTRNWLTGGKKILMSPNWIEKIRWSNNLVSIDLKKESIAQSPAYDPTDPLDDQLELKLFKFYHHQHSTS